MKNMCSHGLQSYHHVVAFCMIVSNAWPLGKKTKSEAFKEPWNRGSFHPAKAQVLCTKGTAPESVRGPSQSVSQEHPFGTLVVKRPATSQVELPFHPMIHRSGQNIQYNKSNSFELRIQTYHLMGVFSSSYRLCNDPAPLRLRQRPATTGWVPRLPGYRDAGASKPRNGARRNVQVYL